MANIPISREGYERLKVELQELKKQRPGVIAAIKEAREEGDLRENAGYDAAKERQGMLEAKINQIESRLACCDIIDLETLDGETVTFGAWVELEDIESGERKCYTLLGPDEADLSRGSISVLSPVGKALLGKRVGDEAVVNAPKGQIEYEVISIRFKRSD